MAVTRARNPRLQLVTVGRVKPPFAEAVADYEARLDRRLGLRVDEVAAEPLGRDPARARAREGARIRDRLLPHAWTVALDPEARPPASSQAFADALSRHLDHGVPVTWVVGGASGIEASLMDECRERIGLGPLTMPHQLARLVLVEQIYRAMCIIDGHPYPH